MPAGAPAQQAGDHPDLRQQHQAAGDCGGPLWPKLYRQERMPSARSPAMALKSLRVMMPWAPTLYSRARPRMRAHRGGCRAA